MSSISSLYLGICICFILCRFSRARRVVENAFGILASRFRILRNPILQNYVNSTKTVKACIVLHNYIMQNFNDNGSYLNSGNLRREGANGEVTPGSWEQDGCVNSLYSVGQLAGNRSGTKAAKDQRDLMARIMLTDGLAPWQFQNALRSV